MYYKLNFLVSNINNNESCDLVMNVFFCFINRYSIVVVYFIKNKNVLILN